MIKQEYISNSDIIGLLGQRVKAYRLTARMSQRELAYKYPFFVHSAWRNA